MSSGPQEVPATVGLRTEPSWVLAHAGWVLFGGIMATVTIALVGLFLAPHWPTFEVKGGGLKHAELQAQREQDIRETAIKVATGVGAAVAGVLAWARLDLSRQEHALSRDQHELARVAQSHRARLAEESQRTERYTRAVEQLGHGSPDVQLGALYALERLGSDSGSDRVTITEVLCAFVRGHGDRLAERPSITVQAAVTILGRNDWDVQIDLRGAALRGVDLEESDLSVALLDGAMLAAARARFCSFQAADLSGADISGGDFGNANFEDADLVRTDMSRADFEDANFRGGQLVGSILAGASMRGADLSGASLRDADLTAAICVGANLTGARLHGAQRAGAVFDDDLSPEVLEGTWIDPDRVQPEPEWD